MTHQWRSLKKHFGNLCETTNTISIYFPIATIAYFEETFDGGTWMRKAQGKPLANFNETIYLALRE